MTTPGVFAQTGTDPRGVLGSMLEEGWNAGRLEDFDATMAASIRFHYGGQTQTLTREDAVQLVVAWRNAFPDLRMDLEELLVEGELAAARVTFTGTHLGPFAGAPPTGRKVSMPIMMFCRFADGKMVELWENDDQLGLRRQLSIGD